MLVTSIKVFFFLFITADEPLGGGCDPDSIEVQCSDPYAACLINGSDYICTCDLGYYDDNGYDSSGHCQNSEY